MKFRFRIQAEYKVELAMQRKERSWSADLHPCFRISQKQFFVVQLLIW